MTRSMSICIVCCVCLLASCSSQPQNEALKMVKVQQMNPMDDFNWLLGTWQQDRGEQITFESWQQESDKAFVGKGVTVKDRDTTLVEYLRLENTDSGHYYVAMVSHNPTPTLFRLISAEGKFTFENPEHDFPNRIIYRQIGEDSMVARIEGERDGQPAGIDFYFMRIK